MKLGIIEAWCAITHHVLSLNCYTNLCIHVISHWNIKMLKSLQHVSIYGSSSGSHTLLAKVTIKTVTDSFRCITRVLWQHVVLRIAESAQPWVCVLYCAVCNCTLEMLRNESVTVFIVTLARSVWLADDDP